MRVPSEKFGLEAAKHGAARNKAEADKFAANVKPLVRELQAAGITSQRAIARALTLRGVAVIDDKTTDAELDRLGSLGFKGVRLNLSLPASTIPKLRPSASSPPPRVFRRGIRTPFSG